MQKRTYISGGGMPPPYERYVPFQKLLSRNEPGAPSAVVVYHQGIRLELSAAARRLASPFGRGAQCAHWAERVFLLGAILRKRLPPGGKLPKIFDF